MALEKSEAEADCYYFQCKATNILKAKYIQLKEETYSTS